MIRLHRELRRLHTDRGGQIMPAFMLGAMALVMLVVWTLNTGHHITRKIEVQNSADAAVMTQANWTARSLNVMAMNNTAMSQSLAVAVTAEALALIALEVEATAGLTIANAVSIGPPACTACAASLGACIPCCTTCATAVSAGIAAGVAATMAVVVHVNLADITFGIDYHDLAVGFSEMNDHLASNFPEFSYQVGHALALQNEVDDPIYFPRVDTQTGSPSTALPVAVDTLSESGIEFCGTAQAGTVIDTVLENFVSHGGDYVRGATRGGPFQIARDNLSDRVTKFGDGMSFILAMSVASAIPILLPPTSYNTYDARYRYPFQGGSFDQDEDSNALLQAMNIGWGIYCAGTAVGVLPFNLYKVNERPLVTNAFFPPGETVRDALSIVAFTRRSGQGAPVVGDLFLRGLEDTYGLAQAEVYNVSQILLASTPWGEQPTNYDLYTQGWRARIVPASLLAKKRSEIAQAVSDYPKLADLFNALGDADLGILNVH